MTIVQVWKVTGTGKGIILASLNIQTGQAGGLDTALQVLQQDNVDVGFLQETNLTRGMHT